VTVLRSRLSYVVRTGLYVRYRLLHGMNRGVIKSSTTLKSILRTRRFDVVLKTLKDLGVCINQLVNVKILHLVSAGVMECTYKCGCVRNSEALLTERSSHVLTIGHHGEYARVHSTGSTSARTTVICRTERVVSTKGSVTHNYDERSKPLREARGPEQRSHSMYHLI
jgi:hypothetical protein